MAIYRTGSAALSAEGKATGKGTAWTTPLSLIRVGATVIFLSGSKPVLGTISEIISDTEMNLTATGGDTAADGDYAILIHDSLTVEGLAQDVAEALRYYQGQESEIAGLVDNIQAYLKSAQDSANASANSAAASQQSADASASSASNSAGSAQAAAGSASAAKTSETNAGNKATAADNSAKAAASSQSAAKTSETNAAGSATASANSASAAKTSEQNAASTLAGAVKKSGDTMTDLLIVRNSSNGDNTQVSKGSIEIYAATPFIDMHYNRSAADFSVRMINSEDSALEVTAGSGNVSFRVNGGIRCGSANNQGGFNIYRGNGDANSLWGLNCVDGNFNFLRGGAAGSNVNFGGSLLRNFTGLTGRQGVTGGQLTNPYNFNWTGSALEAWVDSSKVADIVGTTNSDRELKKDIEYLSDLSTDYKEKALSEVMRWSPASFRYKKRGVLPESDEKLGYIANDLVLISPECVKGEGLVPGEWDENNPTGAYTLDQVAMIAKQTMAIQALYEIIGKLTERIKELESKK